jgi:hypothetical protein
MVYCRKRAFERDAMSAGVRVKGYHADNVPFNAEEWKNDMRSKDQELSLSGTGAHHQNGVAERTIKTVVSWARAMLLHMVIHWPDQADLSVWPFALEYSVYIWNHLPNQRTGSCPEEIFTSSKVLVREILRRCRVWGCPVYVLDPKLQDRKKLPKWVARARRGQFLGFSTQHSSTVGKILNLRTGYVSPQYHVVYDELYSTVGSTGIGGEADLLVLRPDQWQELLVSGYERSEILIEAEETGTPLPDLDEGWLSPAEIQERQELRCRRFARRRLLQGG